MAGFVKLDRDIVNWEWYDDLVTFKLFMHLIVTANYTDKEWHGVEIKRGQRIISYTNLAIEARISVQNVRTALSHLESTGEITRRKCGKYTVITVNNYDKFQSANSETTSKQHDCNNLTTSCQHVTNNDIRKKERKEREEWKEEEERKNLSSSSIRKVVEKYIEICKPAQQPTLTKELEANINNALSLYGMDKLTAVFESVSRTPFLNGQVSDWQADLAWIFSNENISKILSGKYREYTRKPTREENTSDMAKYEYFINRIPNLSTQTAM